MTKAPLNEPTIEVMNTTMDTVSSGTLLMDDPGGFWPNGKGCAIYDYDYDVYRGGLFGFCFGVFPFDFLSYS